MSCKQQTQELFPHRPFFRTITTTKFVWLHVSSYTDSEKTIATNGTTALIRTTLMQMQQPELPGNPDDSAMPSSRHRISIGVICVCSQLLPSICAAMGVQGTAVSVSNSCSPVKVTGRHI